MDKQNYFIPNQDSQNCSIEVLREFNKDVSVNSNLLTQIQHYVQEIKLNAECKKSVSIIFKGANDDYPMFYIANNTSEDFLSEELGVSLYTAVDFAMNADAKKVFENCDLYYLFEELHEEWENIAINFSFDAYSLCLAIQYLAQCYNCSFDNISVEIEEEGKQTSLPLNDPTWWMFIVAAIICLLLCIFLFWSAIEFDNTEYFLGAILAGGCMGWCIFKALRYPN